MKKIVAVLILVMSIVGCNHNAVEKPDKLIDEGCDGRYSL